MLSLRDVRFRSSSSVELRKFDDLSHEERERFRDLTGDPDFYGLFVPRPPFRSNLKSVPRQTAELFRRLAEPARLDEALLGDEQSAGEVLDLVLDGILEIDGGDGFVSGADALPLVGAPRDVVARDVAARLSIDALHYAQDLVTADPGELETALYQYNRIPITPAWKARFPDRDAILAEIGADRAPLRDLLERSWTRSDAPGWITWSSRRRSRRTADDVTFKLYVSPRPERIRDAFEVVVRALPTLSANLKIGDRASGLLRPDKLIAYFSTRARLDRAADALRRELAGCDAQGVPFTGSLDDSGLLSWGVDPPPNDRPLQWLPRDSWRVWLTRRLGLALSIAKNARRAAAAEPWRFAVERVRREGVDVDTWTPAAALWKTK
jgi:hypothetical protein